MSDYTEQHSNASWDGTARNKMAYSDHLFNQLQDANKEITALRQQLAESQARCARMAVEIVRLRLDDYTPSNEIEAGGGNE